MYVNIEHVTCLAYVHHKAAEEIINYFPIVNDLILNIKKVFLKSFV